MKDSSDRCVSVSVDLSKVEKAVVLVSVLDINDNAPRFAIEYQTFVCENSRPGQVKRTYERSIIISQCYSSLYPFLVIQIKNQNQKNMYLIKIYTIYYKNIMPISP